jgi:23S rRNA A2030 N6-methylase RlmJ
VFVFNPPWTLDAAMRKALPALKRLLAQDASADFSIDGRQV